MKATGSAGPKEPWQRDALARGGTPWRFLPLILAPFVALLAFGFFRGNQRDSVILYCAQDQVFAEPLLARFTARTGIRVKPVFDSEAVKTVGLANRLLAERSNPVCDVYWGNEELRARQMMSLGVFVPTNGWAAFGHRSRRLVVRDQAAGRPEGLPEGVPFPPRSVSELTNAAFRGRVSMAFPLFGTTATHLMALRSQWGESNWLAWCRALAANAPFLEEGNSQVVRRVARGEAWVGWTDSDDIASAQREGLAVTAVPTGPDTLLIPNTVALVAKPGAPSPQALRLFGFLRSGDVESALVAAGALESGTPEAASLRPDWGRLVSDLDVAAAHLREVFRR